MRKYGLVLFFMCIVLISCQNTQEQHYHLANRYFAFNLIPEAIKEYTLAIASNLPDGLKSECQYMLAESYRKNGDITDSIKAYKDYLRLYPDSDRNWKCNLMLGRLFSAQTPYSHDETMEYYRAAMKSRAKTDTGHFIQLEMADVLLRYKRYQECQELLQSLREDSFKGDLRIRHLNTLGKLKMYYEHDFNGALSYFKKSYETGKFKHTSMETLIGMAECYRRLGLEEQSLTVYNELVKNYPDSAVSIIADSFISHLKTAGRKKEDSLTRLQESFEEFAGSSAPTILPREERLEIAADSTVYSGKVTIQRHNMKLEAQKMVFDRTNNQIKAQMVTVSVPDKMLRISGANAIYDLRDGTIFIEGEARISTRDKPERTATNIGLNTNTGEILTAETTP